MSAPTPPPDVADDRHSLALWWIEQEFRGARSRAQAARRRLAGASAEELLACRRPVAVAVRGEADRVIVRARQPLRDRALMIEVSEDPEAVRDLLIEVSAIGVVVEL